MAEMLLYLEASTATTRVGPNTAAPLSKSLGPLALFLAVIIAYILHYNTGDSFMSEQGVV